MKNIAILATFANIILLSTFTFAQKWEEQKPFKEAFIYGCDPSEENYEFRPSCGVVIALSGIKLRSKPSFDAKTLALIPFGSTVHRTEKGYDLFPHNYWSDIQMTSDSIRGYWQEIIWNGKKGFAFSAFIGNAIHRMNNDCYLLFETEYSCWNDCYASLSYHYYGVFTDRDSSRWELKKIKPTFIYLDVDILGTSIRSETKQRPSFILAMKNPLKEGLLMTNKINEIVYQNYFQEERTKVHKKVKIPLSSFALSVIDKPGQENTPRRDLLLTEHFSGRKQVLLTDFYTNKIDLVWSGDLDGDGIMDFMLSYSDDHSYGCQLFLSSLAKGNQLVKPIKIYWYGDCC